MITWDLHVDNTVRSFLLPRHVLLNLVLEGADDIIKALLLTPVKPINNDEDKSDDKYKWLLLLGLIFFSSNILWDTRADDDRNMLLGIFVILYVLTYNDKLNTQADQTHG